MSAERDIAEEKIAVDGSKIIIFGTPAETKEEFFELMKARVEFMSEADFREIAGDTGEIGNFSARISCYVEGKILDKARIIVNKDSFILAGEDYSDLMPIAIHHEISELWMNAKRGFSPLPIKERNSEATRRGLSHGYALRQEYAFAYSQDKHERYLEFILKSVASFEIPEREKMRILDENISAYQRVLDRMS